MRFKFPVSLTQLSTLKRAKCRVTACRRDVAPPPADRALGGPTPRRLSSRHTRPREGAPVFASAGRSWRRRRRWTWRPRARRHRRPWPRRPWHMAAVAPRRRRSAALAARAAADVDPAAAAVAATGAAIGAATAAAAMARDGDSGRGDHVDGERGSRHLGGAARTVAAVAAVSARGSWPRRP